MFGISNIESVLDRLHQAGRTGLIPYITAGHPRPDLTGDIALALARNGADLIELGLPFSDPMADGPVIREASTRALAAGTNLGRVLEAVRQVREQSPVPLLIMSYCNPLFSYGVENLARDAAAAGLDGFLVPDLPPEEAGPLREALDSRGLALVPFAAPTATPERLSLVGAGNRGFVYAITVPGITGERARPSEHLQGLVERLRHYTQLPVAAGFGISTPEQARQAGEVAEAVVVGSALVAEIQRAQDAGQDCVIAAGSFIRRWRQHLDGTEFPADHGVRS